MINFDNLTNKLRAINDEKIDSDELYDRFNSNNGRDFKWSYITYNADDPIKFNGKDMVLIFDNDNIVFELNPKNPEIINQFKLGGSYWGENTKGLLDE